LVGGVEIAKFNRLSAVYVADVVNAVLLRFAVLGFEEN
jgi:hypothetical protein